jgi:hypothetical protein
MTKSALAVEVDGRALPPDEARALWEEFSRYLEAHELDFDGFAKSKGFVSVRPTHKAGRAVLLVETKLAAPKAKKPAASPKAPATPAKPRR